MQTINLETITPEEYEQYVSGEERFCYHCIVSHDYYDEVRGEVMTNRNLVKYDEREFETVKHWLLVQKYDVKVLHKPAKRDADGKPVIVQSVSAAPKKGRPRSTDK